MDYQTIPRKFRPQKFSNVVSQDDIVLTLKNGIRLDHLSHAYIFCGSRGTGKTTLARILAKAVNCQNLSDDQEPCGVCSSCKEITSGQSLDVLEVDGASNRGIDDIRQINETVGYAPANGKYKIYIIDEVHMLTKEAFNALLKTLEEPPPNIKFFFATTEPHKVPQTIISRCQRFHLKRISNEQIVKKLQEITENLQFEVEEDALKTIAKMGDGSLRDAESLLDQALCFQSPPVTLEAISKNFGLVPQDLFFDLDKAIYEKNLPYAFILSEEIYHSGKNINFFLESLIQHHRHILMLKLELQSKLLSHLPSQIIEKYKEVTAFYDKQQCITIFNYLTKALEEIHKHPFKKMHLEMIFLFLLQSKDKLTFDHFIRKLHHLEEKLANDSEEKKEPEKQVEPSLNPKKEKIEVQTPPSKIAPETPASEKSTDVEDLAN